MTDYYAPPIFETVNNTQRRYTQRFGPIHTIWEQQDNPVLLSEDINKGNLPNPVLRNIVRGVDEGLREKTEVLLQRDHVNAAQLRFNHVLSGTSTSYVGSREDAHENYSHMLTVQKFQDNTLLKKIAFFGLLWWVVTRR